MGIDVYLRWDGMTEADFKAQITGFAIDKGSIGYLREAYHGEPYATKVLAPEAFGSEAAKVEEGNNTDHGIGVPISADTMQARLPEVVKAAIKRGKQVYSEDLTMDSPAVKAFIDFVELAAVKETETRKPVRVYASY